MTTEIEKLLQTFKGQVEKLPEEYEGYRKDLYDYVTRIIMYEREHKVSRIDIVQKVSDQCEALAVLMNQHNTRKAKE